MSEGCAGSKEWNFERKMYIKKIRVGLRDSYIKERRKVNYVRERINIKLFWK